MLGQCRSSCLMHNGSATSYTAGFIKLSCGDFKAVKNTVTNQPQQKAAPITVYPYGPNTRKRSSLLIDSRWADIYKFEFRLTLMTIMFLGLILKINILPLT